MKVKDGPQKYIRVEYELPPLRAIYHKDFADDGQTDEEIRQHFPSVLPREDTNPRIRKISRGLWEGPALRDDAEAEEA